MWAHNDSRRPRALAFEDDGEATHCAAGCCTPVDGGADSRSTRLRSVARLLAAVLALATLSGVGLSTRVAQAEDCDRFLPDFTCDDREARPEGHVAPMSMPYLFEDPYITTEINLVGIYHNFPSDSIFQGGEAGVIAIQARLALTDKLAFIATKDGYTFLRPDNGPLGVHVQDGDGFMDITVGFKYAAYEDKSQNLIVTPSFRYEIPLGNDDVFQGRGDGVAIPAVSVGWGPDAWHVIADLGAQIAADGDKDSSSIFYNFHVDHAFESDWIPGADFIVPFIELNGISYVDSGDGSTTVNLDGAGRVPLSVAQDVLYGAGITADRRGEGADVVNLGSKGMAGEDIVTMAWGIRVPFRNGISTGVSYERVLSQRQDIFEQRFTAMVSYTF